MALNTRSAILNSNIFSTKYETESVREARRNIPNVFIGDPFYKQSLTLL